MDGILNSLPAISIYAILFGSTMKIADLLDEHNLKWFRGSAITFGVLWGFFGALMVMSNIIIANFIIAMILHWILRYRIDYLNHGIATVIILFTFLYNLPNFSVDWVLVGVALIGYGIHGLLNDASDKGTITGTWAKYFQSNSHYLTIPLVLIAIDTSYWVVLVVSLLHMISYEITKKFGMQVVRRQQRAR